MASVNKVILLGNLGADPETRYSQSGDAITNIRIATTEKWKNKDGEQQEKTEWHRIVFFGRLAEVAGEYLHKGSPCFVEGQLTTRKWTDKEGKDQYTTEIKALSLQLLGQRGDSSSSNDRPTPQQRARNEPPKKPAAKPAADDFDDDIPF